MIEARRGLILFAHGARDARWAQPFERLRELVVARVTGVPVALAYLELMQPDLAAAAHDLVRRGCVALTIVPVFLGEGGHVRRDLPERVAALRSRYPQVAIDCTAAAGEDHAVLAALADYCVGSLIDNSVNS